MAQESRKRRSLTDFFRYQLKRLQRLQDQPHAIALGACWGVWVSFTPLYGFHLIICTLACIMFGGSKVASWIASLVGNPLTFPIFLFWDYHLWSLIVGGLDAPLSMPSDFTFEAIKVSFLGPLFLPWLYGGFILGGVFGIGTYWGTLQFIRLTRIKRRKRMDEARAYWAEIRRRQEVGVLEGGGEEAAATASGDGQG